MRRLAARTLSLLILFAVVLAVAADGRAALPPDHPAMKLLAKAHASIRDGKAAEAGPSLEELKKLFPNTPEADEADKLLKRLASQEVLLECSHEWRGEAPIVAEYLRRSGIGVAISDASLDSLKDRLADFEIIFIWQETSSIQFSDSEITLLKAFAKDGGRILVIGTTKGPPAYPLRALLTAFDCPMRAPQAQVNFGQGKVQFIANTGLFSEARMSDPRESQVEVVEIFQKLMPYEQLNRSAVNSQFGPELFESLKPVRLEYSARLAASADRTKDLIAKILEQTMLVYKDELADGLTIRLLPRPTSEWMGGAVFAPGTLQGQADYTRELTRAVMLYGLFPQGKWINYPPWVTNGWCDLMAERACFKLGYKHEAETWRKETLDAFKPSGVTTDGLDLSVSRLSFQREYLGKAMWAYEQLETREKDKDKKSRETTPVLAKLRRTLKRYAAAGRIGESMSTRDVIFYLSQSLREDLFPFFQSMGTTVTPVKLDYYELDKIPPK